MMYILTGHGNIAEDEIELQSFRRADAGELCILYCRMYTELFTKLIRQNAY